MADFRRNARNDQRDEWRTPGNLFRSLSALVGGFSLDAAATAENSLCEEFLSGPCISGPGCNCGLCVPWPALSRVWINPPYGATSLLSWARKVSAESHRPRPERPAVIAMLVPVSSSARWWGLCWRTCTNVLLLHPRVQFVHPPGCGCTGCARGHKSSNTGDSALFVWASPEYMPRQQSFVADHPIEVPAVELVHWPSLSTTLPTGVAFTPRLLSTS